MEASKAFCRTNCWRCKLTRIFGDPDATFDIFQLPGLTYLNWVRGFKIWTTRQVKFLCERRSLLRRCDRNGKERKTNRAIFGHPCPIVFFHESLNRLYSGKEKAFFAAFSTLQESLINSLSSVSSACACPHPLRFCAGRILARSAIV